MLSAKHCCQTSDSVVIWSFSEDWSHEGHTVWEIAFTQRSQEFPRVIAIVFTTSRFCLSAQIRLYYMTAVGGEPGKCAGSCTLAVNQARADVLAHISAQHKNPQMYTTCTSSMSRLSSFTWSQARFFLHSLYSNEQRLCQHMCLIWT